MGGNRQQSTDKLVRLRFNYGSSTKAISGFIVLNSNLEF